jgi:hypothetical protein
MKFLIDDERTELPDKSIPDVILRKTSSAFSLLTSGFFSPFDELFVDNDMGKGEKEGFEFLNHMETLWHSDPEWAVYNIPREIHVVSANLARIDNMEYAIKNIKQERDKWEALHP